MLYIGSFDGTCVLPDANDPSEREIVFRILVVADSIEDADRRFRAKLAENYSRATSPLREYPRVTLRSVIAVDPEGPGALMFEMSHHHQDVLGDVFQMVPEQDMEFDISEYAYEGYTEEDHECPWYVELLDTRPRHGIQFVWSTREPPR